MATLLKADGTETEVVPNNGTDFSLEELKDFVGGWIEIVRTGRGGKLMVINEEGKLLGLLINERATALYANPYDVVVGDVLVCEDEEVL